MQEIELNYVDNRGEWTRAKAETRFSIDNIPPAVVVTRINGKAVYFFRRMLSPEYFATVPVAVTIKKGGK